MKSLPLPFTTKKNRQVIFRLLNIDDVEQSRTYINQISAEDTFIGFSGEQLSQEEELKYVQDNLQKMSEGNGLYVVAEFEKRLLPCAMRGEM